MEKGDHRDEGQSHTDATTSYELSSRSISPPPIYIEKGYPHRDKGKFRADAPVPTSPRQGTSSLQHTGKSRVTDSSVSQPITSSDTPYETSFLVMRSISLPPIIPGQPIASSSSRRLEGMPDQNAQSSVEASSDYASQSLNRIRTIRTTRWRVVNTYFLLIAGISKSISAYKDASAPANSLDLVIGIVWALISYWFSIFENEDPNMIPWLFQPTQLDMCETIAPIALPCSFFLISFLLLKAMVFAADLDTYLIKHLDTGSFSSLRILLIVAMMYFTITFLVHIVEVLVPAGFKFFQFLYAKLWFIIKLVVFHSSDWEIDPETLVFFGAFFLLLWIELPVFIASITFLFPSYNFPRDSSFPSFQVDAPVAFGLAFFPMYFVLGFGRTSIRLANWLYDRNKAQIKDILSSLSSTFSKVIPTSNQTQRRGRVS